ncbi:hypothetical protein K2173_019068 [Erythroxylum novogranatense]|uniref:Hexosyltransferase n=1 Tax=Erythroxylum novogranatense TaxID=1862640 RepID=A0AAV8STA2_9ROSI|nr:hypothetical protein K2173_019068 [Erythroxylum novogranatense]
MKRRRVFIIGLLTFFIFFFFLLYFFVNIGVKPVLLSSKTSTRTAKSPDKHSKFSILIGIITRADKYDRRHFLRLVYGIQSSSIANIDVKFVFGRLTKPEQRVLVGLEIERFDDIIILNCSENKNSGKTYTFFSSQPRFSEPYDYVMKADDDVYIRLEPLSLSLKPLPRQDLYYGFVIPCKSMNPYVEYMSGMGYLLSWDLDKLVGKWLNIGKKAKIRISNKPAMYDYPGTNGNGCFLILIIIPETVAVHRLKRWDQWFHVLRVLQCK